MCIMMVVLMHRHDSSWWVVITRHDDSAWWVIMLHRMIQHDESSGFIVMIRHDESWWFVWVTVIHHDASSWFIMNSTAAAAAAGGTPSPRKTKLSCCSGGRYPERKDLTETLPDIRWWSATIWGLAYSPLRSMSSSSRVRRRRSNSNSGCISIYCNSAEHIYKMDIQALCLARELSSSTMHH